MFPRMLRPSPARGRLISALWAVALLACGPAFAAKAKTRAKAKQAGRGTVAIVELHTPPTMMGLGAQVAQQVETSARQQGFTPLPPSEVHEKLGPEAAQKLHKCNVDRTCIVNLLRPLAVDRIVFGSLERDEKSYLLKLWLVEGRSGEIVADVDRSILIASRRFRQDVAELVPRLLRGEKEARGTLTVSSNVKNAAVFIDGAPVGKTPVTVELKPGKYLVQLEKKAYLPIKRYVDVFANKQTEEEFRLLLEPGGVPEEDEVPALVAKSAAPPQQGLQIRTPAWVAFGVAAVVGGAGAYYGFRSERLETDLERGFDGATQTYQGTRASALEGQSHARTANILFGAAGAAALAGVVLTVLDVGGDADVSASPTAGPDGAGVTVGGRF